MACLLKRKPDERNIRYQTETPCYSYQCARCGWSEIEHERRLKRGLVTDENGLRHFIATKPITIKDGETD